MALKGLNAPMMENMNKDKNMRKKHRLFMKKDKQKNSKFSRKMNAREY